MCRSLKMEEAPLLSQPEDGRRTTAKVLEMIPVNVNGLALGMIGLGVTWQSAAGECQGN